MSSSGKKLKISFNSPVILCFAILCLLTLILNMLTNGLTNRVFFSVYRSPMTDPLTYVRFVGHIFGHADWEHFIGNITLLLVVGPMLEKYGSLSIFIVILITAVVTGVVNFVFFPNVQLLGASGVVFAFILLSSMTSIREGSIPLTFILVAVIYIGGQIYDGIFVNDNVSNLTHIIGGLVGSCFGFVMSKNKVRKY